MKPPFLAAALLVAAAASGVAQEVSGDAQSVGGDIGDGIDRIDRILAIVDDDPILDSDVERALGLGLVSVADEEAAGEAASRRAVLDQLIEERLRFHEIDRFGFTEISLDEVDRGYGEIRDRFASDTAFDDRLAELGIEPDGLRQLVARQILVLTYVEERLGSRVFVSLDDIRQYYTETLQPEMKTRGAAVPPLPEVREEIRAVLRQQRLNEEIERWTEELRIEADIDDFFDAPLDELPPHLIDTIEPDAVDGSS